MRSDLYHSYLRSPAWNQIRKRRLKIAGYECENCGKRTRLEVHHKHYRRLGDEWITDLLALCNRCHRRFDDMRRYDRWQLIAFHRLVKSWYRLVLDKIGKL